MNLFLCLDCDAIVNLTKHGRCEVCGSDGVVRRSIQHVALIARLYPEYSEIEELEELWKK
jgi:uncharacterized paraquat-inducible protein A